MNLHFSFKFPWESVNESPATCLVWLPNPFDLFTTYYFVLPEMLLSVLRHLVVRIQVLPI